MKYTGKIKKLNHIVVSDPSYKKDVWCRYEIDNLKEKDWLVDLEINRKYDKVGSDNISYIEFFILIKKDNDISELDDDGSVTYKDVTDVNEYTICMDTACIAMGINKKAKEIIDSVDEWQPNGSIRTGTDGTFGMVYEGKDSNKNLCFVYLYGYFDTDMMGYTEDHIKEYLMKQFEITDLEKAQENIEL